jgi:hypothetical protein
MTRRGIQPAVIAAIAAVVIPVASFAAALIAGPANAANVIAARRPPSHRLHRAGPPLPTSLTVDEQEYSIILSEAVVAAGNVRFTIYNRGQDEHNLVIQRPDLLTHHPDFLRGPVYLTPGDSATKTVRLTKGTYLLYCSMFMGTPQSHYAMGMHTLLTVR